LGALLPVVLVGIAFALSCYWLAREKGRNKVLWLVLGLIPVVNFFALPYITGAPSRILEEKVDRLLFLLEQRSSG